MKSFKEFALSLVNRELMPTAIKVALVVGTILFTINHGTSLLTGKMNRERWISGFITYFVPYMVNIHGQWISRAKNR